MTCTDRLVTGVIAALLAPAARLNEMNAAFGVANVCAAFATTIEVMMATTVAMRMTPGRKNFWIRIVIAFICFGFFVLVFLCVVPVGSGAIALGGVPAPKAFGVGTSGDALRCVFS